MRFFLVCVLLLFFQINLQCQVSDSLLVGVDIVFPIIKPNTLSVHPLGMYIARINHNFKTYAQQKKSFSFEISNGNVWLPYVKSYELQDVVDQKIAEGIPWHEREGKFDVNTVLSKTKEFLADGVLRSYRMSFCLPINTTQEITIGIRSYSLDKGKGPFSLVTSDNSIEWFHSNIAGGEDPFSRKFYGLNNAQIVYKDANDNYVRMNSGDFVIPGIELDYLYYPKLTINDKRKIYLNFGAHIGVNTSQYNPVADIGFSTSGVKKINFAKNKSLELGISAGALRQATIVYGNRVAISGRKFISSFESNVTYQKQLKKKRAISLALNYNLQSAYFNPSDFEHVVLTGNRHTSHWHYAISELYSGLQAWSFIFTFAHRRIAYCVYVREDLLVDNAPDLQTGFGINVFLK
ncbi:MAG: hypothetical protein J0M08_06275 [Bacteroidetes bacterium]|nr:hypothetical protein [Bacteroidota bacterium]